MKHKIRDGELVAVALLVGLSFAVANAVLKLVEMDAQMRVLIGLLPAALLAFELFWAFVYLRQQDELQRRIGVEALAFAFPIGLVVIFAVGFLKEAGVKLPLTFIDGGYVLIGSYLIGYFLANRRYK